jgi:hypothetical protein
VGVQSSSIVSLKAKAVAVAKIVKPTAAAKHMSPRDPAHAHKVECDLHGRGRHIVVTLDHQEYVVAAVASVVGVCVRARVRAGVCVCVGGGRGGGGRG